MTVDYELEFEGSSELVYTDHDKWSLSRRTFGRHRMVCRLRKRKKEEGQEKITDRLDGDFNKVFLPSLIYFAQK